MEQREQREKERMERRMKKDKELLEWQENNPDKIQESRYQ